VVLPLYAVQEPKPAVQKKAAALTDEEREILNNREILENLELLQNFDKFWYFDLFAEKGVKKTKNPAKEAEKKEERKEK
jgi:hypothetical protein